MLSLKSTLHFSVPQGSVLGPILFNIYSSPITGIAQSHGLFVHAYADDTQLCIPFKLNGVLERLQACLIQVKSSMTWNKLKLNHDKTDFLVMTTIKFH